MATLTIVGLGPGPLSLLTGAAEAELLSADKVYFRLAAHPAFYWLRDLGKKVVPFDALYGLNWPSRSDLYAFIAKALMQDARTAGKAVYAVPGSPFVLEETEDMRERRPEPRPRGNEGGQDGQGTRGRHQHGDACG